MSGGHVSIDEVKNAARGRVQSLLVDIGDISPELLDGNHHPCPKCGGEDRFRVIDVEAGAAICNQCLPGTGDFVATIQHFRDWDFVTTLRECAAYLRMRPAEKQKAPRPTARKGKLAAPKFLADDESKLALASFAEAKKIPLESLVNSGAKATAFPPTNGTSCVAMPIFDNPESNLAGILLARADGSKFPAVIVEAAVRSFPPVDPFCLRLEHPIWVAAEDLDPSAFKSDRPRRKAADPTAPTAEDLAQQKLDGLKAKLMDAYKLYPDGATASMIRQASGMSGTKFNETNAELVRSGYLTTCKVSNGPRKYDGFKIISYEQLDILDKLDKTQSSPSCPSSESGTSWTWTDAPPLGASSCPTSPTSRTGSESNEFEEEQSDELSNFSDEFPPFVTSHSGSEQEEYAGEF